MIQWTFCRFHLLGFALKYLQISSTWSWFPVSLIDQFAFFAICRLPYVFLPSLLYDLTFVLLYVREKTAHLFSLALFGS